jgi:hypothetical protein
MEELNFEFERVETMLVRKFNETGYVFMGFIHIMRGDKPLYLHDPK